MINRQKRIANWTMAAVIGAAALGGLNQQAWADQATKVSLAIWAHGELYDTVATDTEFKSPPPKSTDIIFNFDMSGLTGQHSVAAAAPGDRDYNGGRWNVMLVMFTDLGKSIHDPDGDGEVNFELTDAETVLHHAELGHLVIVPAGFYFECPMIPHRRGDQDN